MMRKMEDIGLGNRIKNFRKSKGLSMEAFGKMLDPPASKGAVSNWENGYNKPNNERLLQISSIFGISIIELNYGSNEDYIKYLIEKAHEVRRKFFDSENNENEDMKYFTNSLLNEISAFITRVLYEATPNADISLSVTSDEKYVKEKYPEAYKEREEKLQYIISEILKKCKENNVDLSNESLVYNIIRETVTRLMMKEDYTNEGLKNFVTNELIFLNEHKITDFIFEKNSLEIRDNISEDIVDKISAILEEMIEKIKKIN